MGFKNFLSAVGHDFVNVLKWTGSAKGQAAIVGTETVVNEVVSVVDPAIAQPLNAVEGLINAGLRKALSIEGTAAALGAQSGTGAQKEGAVVASLASESSSFLQTIGISKPTADQVQTLSVAISKGVVGVLSAIPAPVLPPTQPTPTPASPAPQNPVVPAPPAVPVIPFQP